jgi:glucan endo-1,3-beta-D-glucosidase
LSGTPIGHVDTWTAWVNGSNQAVINACDWIGVDAYPYFQNTQSNGIENGKSLFEAALSDTQAAVGGKELWITETGWPVSGSTQNLAVPSTENAKKYWDEVGCPRFGKVNTWWFTLQDATPTTPNPSFGLVGAGSDTPLFDLSCDGASPGPSSSSSKAPSSPASTPSSTKGSDGSESSVTGSATTVGSSASGVTSEGPVVSSGGGLSPSQGGGIVPINPSGATGSASTPASGPFPTSAGNNISVSAGQPSTALTTATTVVTGSGGSAAPSSTGPQTVDANGAVALSGSLLGAVGALFAAVVAL